MCAVEAAVAHAQASIGDIPSAAAREIAAACNTTVGVEVLADGWRVGTPVLGLLDALRARLPEDARQYLHRGLTTQDVVDTAAMLLSREALAHLGELADAAASSLPETIEHTRAIATQARSFLQPADVTTVAFRTARWLDQLNHARRRISSSDTPVQIGGLIGDRVGMSQGVAEAAAARLGLVASRPWHTDRSPVIALVGACTDIARCAAKVGGDIAQLVQLGEVTTRAGGSSAAAGKRNPIDAMRAIAAAEACLGLATIVTHSKPHELERGLGSWHAEWFALPLVFQTAAASIEALRDSLASLEVEPSALVVADDRRAAADAYIASVLEDSP
jgi:3-carboxy-cis,cis-muconate cycloisomerase